jgi:hypothetical protein
MAAKDLVPDLQDLVHVAGQVWLGRAKDQADAENVEQKLVVRRQARRDRLAQVESFMERIDEIDARITLVEISEHVPDREKWLRRLMTLRDRLIRRTGSAGWEL